MTKSITDLKLISAFEVIAKKFNTSAFKVALAYANNNENVASMVNKMTGLK